MTHDRSRVLFQNLVWPIRAQMWLLIRHTLHFKIAGSHPAEFPAQIFWTADSISLRATKSSLSKKDWAFQLAPLYSRFPQMQPNLVASVPDIDDVHCYSFDQHPWSIPPKECYPEEVVTCPRR